MVKTASEVQLDIQHRFENKIRKLIQNGSTIDLFNLSISNEFGTAYQTIEDNKNPHLYSKLSGTDLDDMCAMVGLTRRDGETDNTLLYRLHNWTLDNSKGNSTACNDILLNLTYASNATYVPMVYGCGTAVVYVIPKEYSNDIITKALEEAKEKLESVQSPCVYTQYIVPKSIPIKMSIALSVADDTDISFVESLLELKIQSYINNIAPKDYMDIGAIEKMCLSYDKVTYFRILSYTVDGDSITSTKVLQDTETKMLYDTIIWTES